ncbi:hypothetical protein C8J56DRAFT_900763 [Mycena floridula]|nr:hypothetical protein C8J56DRAFT_900763 [Mycena floridula]
MAHLLDQSLPCRPNSPETRLTPSTISAEASILHHGRRSILHFPQAQSKKTLDQVGIQVKSPTIQRSQLTRVIGSSSDTIPSLTSDSKSYSREAASCSSRCLSQRGSFPTIEKRRKQGSDGTMTSKAAETWRRESESRVLGALSFSDLVPWLRGLKTSRRRQHCSTRDCSMRLPTMPSPSTVAIAIHRQICIVISKRTICEVCLWLIPCYQCDLKDSYSLLVNPVCETAKQFGRLQEFEEDWSALWLARFCNPRAIDQIWTDENAAYVLVDREWGYEDLHHLPRKLAQQLREDIYLLMKKYVPE